MNLYFRRLINNTKTTYIVFMIMVMLNIFLVPNKLVPQIFALFYLTLIYLFITKDLKKYIYYSTILFVILDFGMTIPIAKYDIYYFYIPLFIYLVLWIYIPFIGNISSNLNYLRKSKAKKYIIFLLIFTGYMLLSALWAVSIKDVIVTSFVYIVMLSLVVMVVFENRRLKDFYDTLKFLEYIYIGTITLGLVKILGFELNIRNVFSDMYYTIEMLPFLKRMPILFFYNPNNYAVFLLIGMSLIIGKYVSTKNSKEKIYYLVLFCLSVVNLIFTSSRTGWISLYIIFIFIFVYSFIKGKRCLKFPLIQLIIITSLLFVSFSILPGMDQFYGKFNNIPILNKLNFLNRSVPKITISKAVSIGGSGSFSERYSLMDDIIKGIFVKGHFLGFGAGNSAEYIKRLYNTHGIYNIHSLIFEILGDFGIGIFIYYFFIYFSIVYDLLKKSIYTKKESIRNYSLMFLVAIFIFLFLSFSPSSVLSFGPYWILLGLCLSLIISLGDDV